MSAGNWGKLLLLGAIWGGSFFFARIAVLEIAPLTLVLFRVALAAAALHVYLLVAGPSFRLALPMAIPFFGLAMVNNVVPFALMFAGQTELGAGAASILNAMTPFWTMIFMRLFTSEPSPAWNKIAGVALGIAGTLVMIGPGVVTGLGGPVWAKFALLGTAISYGFAFLFSRRFSGLPPQVVATGQLTAATVVMVPVVLLWHGTDGMFAASPHAWAAVAGLALLATAVAYILYFSLVGSAGAANASLVTLIVPVSAILLGAIFLGERLESYELAGMGLIALGLLTIDGRVLRRR